MDEFKFECSDERGKLEGRFPFFDGEDFVLDEAVLIDKH